MLLTTSIAENSPDACSSGVDAARDSVYCPQERYQLMKRSAATTNTTIAKPGLGITNNTCIYKRNYIPIVQALGGTLFI